MVNQTLICFTQQRVMIHHETSQTLHYDFREIPQKITTECLYQVFSISPQKKGPNFITPAVNHLVDVR